MLVESLSYFPKSLPGNSLRSGRWCLLPRSSRDKHSQWADRVWWLDQGIQHHDSADRDMGQLYSKVCAKVLSRLWFCSGQVSVSRIPVETRRTTKDDEEKKTSKRVSRVSLRDLRGKKFQGFLSGTSGEKKIKIKKLRRAHTIEKNT